MIGAHKTRLGVLFIMINNSKFYKKSSFLEETVIFTRFIKYTDMFSSLKNVVVYLDKHVNT